MKNKILHIVFLLIATTMCGKGMLCAQGHISAHAIAIGGATATDSLGTWVSYSVGQTAFRNTGTDTIVEEGIQHALWHNILNDIANTNIEIYFLDESTLAIRGDSKTYIRYRWYRNGQIVAEGTDMHIYHQGNGVPLNGCYHLDVITSSGDPRWQHSDTVCIGTSSIETVQNNAVMRVSPNPAPAGGKIAISLAGITTLPATLHILDAQGRATAHHVITSNISNIYMPTTTGVYMLRIEMPNGGIATTKVIVR